MGLLKNSFSMFIDARLLGLSLANEWQMPTDFPML
jgi:hypothetical protein